MRAQFTKRHCGTGLLIALLIISARQIGAATEPGIGVPDQPAAGQPDEPPQATPSKTPSSQPTPEPASQSVDTQQESLSKIDIVDLNQIGVEETEDPPKNDATVEANVAEDVTASIRVEEILEPPTDYHYAAFGKDNPFQSPDLDIQTSRRAPAGSEIPIVSPLQEYELDTLLVKGIWQLESGEWRAIVMTPKGQGIIVKVGDPISAGKVMTIDADGVTTRQYQIRRDGAREFTDRSLLLNSERSGTGKIILRPGEKPRFHVPTRVEEEKEKERLPSNRMFIEIPAASQPPPGFEQTGTPGQPAAPQAVLIPPTITNGESAPSGAAPQP